MPKQDYKHSRVYLPRRYNEEPADWRRLVFYGFSALILGFFVFTLFVAWVSSDLPDPDKLQDRAIQQSTRIYDRTGEHLLYEVYDEKKRTLIDVASLPKYIVDATIAIEDKRFYEHKGVRWPSIVRAAVANALRLSSGRGGASTLTQQLVKNAILTNEKTFSRKVKEALLALQIERRYTKEQILKLYFNEIPYGSTNYGIESAAQSYFRKSAKDLTLAEAATLAALPQAPSRYLHNAKLLKARRDYVLDQMVENKFISSEEATGAKKQNTDIAPDTQTSIIAPHFVLYVKERLINLFGEKMVDQGGLKVLTTLDFEMQEAANEEVKKGIDAVEKKYDATNGALIAMNPQNGEIMAMVGSRDFFAKDKDGQFNVVTQSVRQPGSSFKPIVYAAAWDKGFTPDTILFDTETDFPYDGKIYHPRNYDGSERGPLTMRQTLQGSLNIPAVKTVFLVGLDRAIEFADRLGYGTFQDRSKFGPSIVLGGGGVKMIEHATAYATFAANGVRQEPVAILKIENDKGEDITPERSEKGVNVLAPELTATVSDVLSDNEARAYIFGAKNYLTLPGRPVAVKTGTTNDYHDAWTIGYVPELAAAVWVGNNDNHSMKRGADGSVVAAPIWQAFMKRATAKLPVSGFPAPPVNSATNPMLRGISGGSMTVKIDTVTGKLATDETPPEITETRTYVPLHDILFYVNPDDPNGPQPSDPSSHPQYTAWEDGVQKWIEKKRLDGSVVFGEPPIEFDDVHKKSLRPTLEVQYPQTGEIITTSTLSAYINVSAPRGIAKVEYRLDGTLISIATQHPFSLIYPVDVFGKGQHTLKVSAFDDVGNATSREMVFHYLPQ